MAKSFAKVDIDKEMYIKLKEISDYLGITKKYKRKWKNATIEALINFVYEELKKGNK